MKYRKAALSLLVNLVYGVYTGILGITTHSWWFITLAAYYVLLSVMRFAVLLSDRKGAEVSGPFLQRFTGIVFLLLSVVLAGTAYLSVARETGSKHHEIVMITIALYAFSKITLAIIHMARGRKNRSAASRTFHSISLADAAASIFSLQRSMLVSFEGMSASNIALFNILTGTAVYLLVFLMGLDLIGGSKIIMAKSKLIQANEKIAEAVVDGYKKIETGVVEGYTKLEDTFIDRFLTHEGETVEDAKKRLKGE